MKVIIAGNRGINDYAFVLAAIEESGWESLITEVVSGGAQGVDTLGEQWANEHGVPIKTFPFPENNPSLSRKESAMMRNQSMAEYADALLAVTDELHSSPGTNQMIELAKGRGLKVFVKVVF